MFPIIVMLQISAKILMHAFHLSVPISIWMSWKKDPSNAKEIMYVSSTYYSPTHGQNGTLISGSWVEFTWEQKYSRYWIGERKKYGIHTQVDSASRAWATLTALLTFSMKIWATKPYTVSLAASITAVYCMCEPTMLDSRHSLWIMLWEDS